MTIAAGFVANDGVLLCADSQFTGAEKQHREKILVRAYREALLGFAITGDDEYARTVIDDSCEGPEELPDKPLTIADIRKRIRRCVRRVLDDYKHSGMPEDNRPELLVAIATPTEGPVLFSTFQTAMRMVERFTFKGSGSYIGNYIVSAFGPSTLSQSIQDLIPIAVYALAAAKRHDAYCGGGSQFIALRGNSCTGVFESDREKSDIFIPDFEQACGQLLGLLGNLTLADESFEGRIEDVIDTLRRIRYAVRDPDSKYRALNYVLGVKQGENLVK